MVVPLVEVVVAPLGAAVARSAEVVALSAGVAVETLAPESEVVAPLGVAEPLPRLYPN